MHTNREDKREAVLCDFRLALRLNVCVCFANVHLYSIRDRVNASRKRTVPCSHQD